MSKECLSILQARLKLGLDDDCSSDSGELVTKRQCLAMGANPDSLAKYSSADECPAGEDVVNGSLIVSLIDWRGYEDTQRWVVDDLSVSIQGDVKLSPNDQVRITGSSGCIDFATDFTSPLADDGGGWFIEYDFRNMGNFEKTIFCFNDYDNLNPISGVAFRSREEEHVHFNLLCLMSNMLENLGYPFGDGDLILPWKDVCTNYVLLVFINDGGNFRLGVTTTDPSLGRQERIQQALMKIKDDIKEPFVNEYPNRWMQVPEYNDFLDHSVGTLDSVLVKNPEYDLPDPDLGPPFYYGYDSIGIIIKSMGILNLK